MGFLQRIAGQLTRFANEEKTPGPEDDFWYEPLLGFGRSTAGIRVTPDVALKASAVFACVRVLAETIATLPIRMRRRIPGGVEDAPGHPLEEVIRHQPNLTQTAVEFWETMILHAALRGIGYAEIVPGARGAVDQLRPLHTDRVTPERLPDGTLRFKVSNPHSGATRHLLQEEVLRIPGMSSDGVSGLRVVDLAADAIGLGMAADEYAARVFSNRLNIGGYLTHPKRLGEDAQKNLIQALMERFAGSRNAHRPILLQEGMTFTKASMDAKEAQLLEARKWQIGEIARYWRIPMHMLGIFDGATHSNVEEQAISFVKYTLRPWVKRIEQAIRRDLIIAKDTYFAEFNLEGLLRGDSAARAAYFSAALGAGGHHYWMLPNEVRAIEGYNPIEGLDEDFRAARLGKAMAELERPERGASAGETLKARAEQLVRKECAAIRKQAMRLADDPDAFRRWVNAFYGGHMSMVMSKLGINALAAKVYCNHQRDQVLGANDVSGLLDRWQSTVADELVATIEGSADVDDA